MRQSQEIRRSFNQAAESYDKAAKVQYEIGHRLISRLDYFLLEPRYILDLGCGTGYFMNSLKEIYPNATIVGLDFAFNMLNLIKMNDAHSQVILSDMDRLPFESSVFDLVFANQVIHWGDTQKIFPEIHRVMNQKGAFLFSTLGPDTFHEIRMAWKGIDDFEHTLNFSDMHDLGDALLTNHFSDPVVDMETLHIQYNHFTDLVNALKCQGVRNVNPRRCKGLTTPNRWNQFKKSFLQFCSPNGKFPLRYEVIYGHAWKGMNTHCKEGTETRIFIDQIKRYQD